MSAPPLSDGATATLEAWLVGVLSTPGLTALRDATAARRALLDDALRAVELVEREEGPVIDVGSGGGTPGIPLAAAPPGFPRRVGVARKRPLA